MLGLSLHNWENVMLIFLGVAAIAAVFVGISTYAVVRLQKVESEDARKDLEEYKLDAGKKIADANVRAAEANLELERFKAPRRIGVEQQARIRDKVKGFKGTTFEIVTYPWESEPAAFAKDIADTLEEATWVFNPNRVKLSLLSPISGVMITAGKLAGPKAEEAGKALAEALASEGIDAKLHVETLQVKPIIIAIEIKIGVKR